MKLTASNLVSFIQQLDRNHFFSYINPRNHGLIKLEAIESPEGPVWIKRWNPTKGETPEIKKRESISVEMLWRIANSLREGQPINVDRILAGSYNTRSVLESLLAHTPQFSFCYPGRVEVKHGHTTIKKGHKHLVWLPNSPHPLGLLHEIETDVVISEVPVADAFYDGLNVPDGYEPELDIDLKRRHAQIQVALYFIGRQLNFRTWVAQNDKGILYQNKRLGEYEGVIAELAKEKMLMAYEEGVRAALLIDCIWFQNSRLMPAVMEIEHTTGVTSGLSRMKHFYDQVPAYPTRYTIVAPDHDRAKVVREANKPQFRALNTKFFPYSAVEELYALCQRRKLRGVTEEFLDCFMEPVVEN